MRCSLETMKEKSEVCGDSWCSLPFVFASLLRAPRAGYTGRWLLEVGWLQGRVVWVVMGLLLPIQRPAMCFALLLETCSFFAFLK